MSCQHNNAYKAKHEDDKALDRHTVFMACKDCGAEWQEPFKLSVMRGRLWWTEYAVEGAMC